MVNGKKCPKCGSNQVSIANYCSKCATALRNPQNHFRQNSGAELRRLATENRPEHPEARKALAAELSRRAAENRVLPWAVSAVAVTMGGFLALAGWGAIPNAVCSSEGCKWLVFLLLWPPVIWVLLWGGLALIGITGSRWLMWRSYRGARRSIW